MRVLIADDQAAVRDGLEMLLGTLDGVEVVGVARDGNEAVALATALAPDLVLMDLRMPDVDGVTATRRIRSTCPGTQVLVLTTYSDDESIVGALRPGASGYLTKDAGREDLERALHAAAAGLSVLDAAVQARLLGVARLDDTSQSGPLPDGLTAREGEVLRLIAEGHTNAQIAERLFVSRVTVKTHVNHILQKTGCRDRAQAVAYALRHGLGA